MTFKNKLLLFVVTILLCALILSGLLGYCTYKSNVKNQVRSVVLEAITQAKDIVNIRMDTIENALFTINVDHDVQRILNSKVPLNDTEIKLDVNLLEDILLSVDRFKKTSSAVCIYAFDKPEYQTLNPYGYTNMCSSNQIVSKEWEERVKAKDGQVLWEIKYNQNGEYIITASMLIKSFIDSKNLGIVTIETDYFQFAPNLIGATLGKTGGLFLVDGKTVLNPRNKKGADILFSNNNANWIIEQAEISRTNWKIAAAVPEKELLNQADILWNVFLIPCIIGLSAALLLSGVLANQISKPIYRLVHAMKKIPPIAKPMVNNYTGEIRILYDSYNKMITQNHELMEDIKITMEKKKKAELRALQAQINPHFLYNTLDSINWMAFMYNANDISLMITSLGKFLRFSLNKGKELISVKNELIQVKSYIEIQKVRFENKFETYFEIAPEIMDCKIIKLTLQPLVENCIMHGFHQIDYIGNIIIKGFKKEEYIYLIVEDNGLGADSELLNDMLKNDDNENRKNSSIGIFNVNQRVRLYYGEDCGLYYSESKQGGLMATVKIKDNC